MWPLPLLARSFLTFVALALSRLSLRCPPPLLLLLLLILIVVALLLLRGLHEGVVDRGEVLHDLLRDDGEGLILSHPHGYVPRECFPEGLDLSQACVVFADQCGEPITILDDGFLGAKFNEDPRPLHCLDAVEDHGDAAYVPIRWLFGDQLLFVVNDEALVEVVLFAVGVDRAQGGEDTLRHDLAQCHRGVMLRCVMFMIHSGQYLVRS